MKSGKIRRYKTNTVELAENGIVIFRSEADNVYTDIDLKEILKLAEEVSKVKPFLLLMVVNEFEFLMTKEARSLFNTDEKAIKLIKAEAAVVRSTPSKIMYNLLTKLHAPKFPFKAFTQEQDAIAWLQTHV